MTHAIVHKDRHEWNMETELALGALAVYGPEQAVEYLYEAHDIEFEQGEERERLERLARRFPEKYQEIRERLAPKIEAMAVTDIRSAIAAQTLPITVATERTQEALDSGLIRGAQAAKVAEQLASTQTKLKDTMMALQGRPAVVKEVRNVDEILRALKALSPDLVIEDAEEVPALKEAT
jgi:hypothetical protein